MKQLTVWILQTGEPLHIDNNSPRPMRAMNLANTLMKKGHNVILWSSAFNHQKKIHRSHKYKKIRISELLEIRLIPSPGYKKNISFARLWDHAILALNLRRLLKRENTQPDIAFIGYPPIESAAVMIQFLKRNNIPCILDIKDQWPNIFVNALPHAIQPIGQIVFSPYFHLAKKSMKDATHLSAMADSFLQWAVTFSGRTYNENNRIIPLTTPIASIPNNELIKAQEFWDAHNILDDGTPYIFFVGSHSAVFDFSTIFETAKKLLSNGKKCEFVICGNDENTKQLIESKGTLSNIHFPGWVNKAQATILAERSLASIAPYHNNEDFKMSIPNKIIDSLSLSLPILSPLDGEVESLINNNDVGISYIEGNSKSLLDSIELLVDNMEETTKMARNAKQLYNKLFSFNSIYDDLVIHLENIANNHHNAGVKECSLTKK